MGRMQVLARSGPLLGVLVVVGRCAGWMLVLVLIQRLELVLELDFVDFGRKARMMRLMSMGAASRR